MFKNKFKELVQNKKELNMVSFEILSNKETIQVIGGCRSLSSCGIFDGTCPNLKTCQRFVEASLAEA